MMIFFSLCYYLILSCFVYFHFQLILIVIIMKINCILDSKRFKGVYRNIDPSEYRPVGISTCRNIDLSEYRPVGISTCRNIDLSD